MILIKPKINAIPNYLSIVARNHIRILNHRQLIKTKIKTGQILGLIKSNMYPQDTVTANNKILDRLQKKEIDLNEALSKISENRNGISSLSKEKITELYDGLISAGHIEFHPTDFCDHKCIGCYYKDEGNSVLPFEYFEKVLRTYNPKSVVLVGGGEPTLYRWKNYRFADIVFEIKRINPAIQIGVVTKGTCIPSGNWQRFVDWIRISLDSATPGTFYRSKKKDAFYTVLDNYITYLKGPIPHVGLGYLYWSDNIHETFELPRYIYNLINEKYPQLISKTNIQYRPMRPGIDVPEKVRKNHVSEDMICSIEQVENAVRGFEKKIKSEPEIGSYIQNHTNWYKVAEGNGVREGKPFSSCYYSLVFKMFRPTGEVYPCFVRVSDPEYLLGNYMNGSRYEHLKISLLTFLLYNRQRVFCVPDKCRNAWTNNIVETGINNDCQMPLNETAKSYFF